MAYYYNWFDWKGFRTAYLNKSTYKNKDDLIHDFHSAFYNATDLSLSKWAIYEPIRDAWKDASVKTKVRAQLEGRGHTRSAINGIIKSFERTLTYYI